MREDHWTLLVVPGEDAGVRQFRLSKRVLRAGLGGGAFLVAAVGVLFVLLGLQGKSGYEAHKLKQENALLVAELDEVRDRVDHLEGALSELAEEGSHLRLLAGLDTLDEEVLEVGVGGPGSATPEEHPLRSVDPALGEKAFAVDYDLNVLERRIRFLSESLTEASDSLEAHRDLLESTPSILPTAGLLSSRFTRSRHHPIHHRPLPHEGVDISAPRGTPILAAAKGRVVKARWESGYGLMVELDHGYGYVTRYGHASKALVREGDTVERGDVIAQVGSTGIATSSHLHYEVRIDGRAVNPMNYVITGTVP